MSNVMAKIISLFSGLSKENKDKVRYILHQDYKVSISTVSNRWISQREIPAKYQAQVLQKIESVAQEQVNELQSLIDTN